MPKGNPKKPNTVNAPVKKFNGSEESFKLAEKQPHPMTRRLLLLIFVPLLFTDCSKDKQSSVPSPDFACTINGQNWVAHTPISISGPAPLYVEYLLPNGDLGIDACRKNSDGTIFQRVKFFVKNVTQPGTYQLHTGDGTITGFVDWNDGSPCGWYWHDTLNPGQLVVTTLDTANHIVKGTSV